MAKRAKKGSRRHHSLKFQKLVTAAAAFDHRTRIIENTVDAQKGVWRLGFDNRYTILVGADGECRVVKG